MKRTKRIICILVTIALLIGMVPAVASNILAPDYGDAVAVGDPEVQTVTVTFKSLGEVGTLVGETTVQVPVGGSLTADQIPTPVVTSPPSCCGGWLFGGWRSPQFCEWRHFSSDCLKSFVITETTVFFAEFGMLTVHCRVTFLWNDGREGTNNIFGGFENRSCIIYDVPPFPSREGFRFVGWTTDAAGYNAFDLDIDLEYWMMFVGGCMYVYAQWEAIDAPQMVTVTFEASRNGTLVGETTVEVPIGGSLTSEQIPTPIPNEVCSCSAHNPIIFHGWDFGGWWDTIDATSLTIIEPMTLRAIFAHETTASVGHTRFLWNDGTDNIIGSLYNDHGMIISVPANPSREGYRFVGWATDAAGNNVIEFAFNADHGSYSVTGLISGCYIYAQWEREDGPEMTHIVIFHRNDNSENIHYVTFVIDGEYLIAPPEPTRGRHIFRGWFKDVTATQAFTDFGMVMEADYEQILHLYAGWRPTSGGGGVVWTPQPPEIPTVLAEFRFSGNGGMPELQRDYIYYEYVFEGEIFATIFTQIEYPVLENYEFLGWFTAPYGGVQVLPTDEISAHLITYLYMYLYAQWEAIAVNQPQRPPSGGGSGWFGGGTNVGGNAATTEQTPIIEVEEEEVPLAELHYDGIHHAFMIGFEDGTVRPMAEVTRAQMATMLLRIMSDEHRTRYWTWNNPFTDVLEANWFNNAVSTATNAGIIVGVSDDLFMPNRAVTRAELAATMVRYMGATPVIGEAQFSDIAGHWAENYINTAAYNGWITHSIVEIGGQFEPDRVITRAEAASVINRALGRVSHSSEALLPGMRTWSDNANPNAWYHLYIQIATNSHRVTVHEDDTHQTFVELIETERNWRLLERFRARPEDILPEVEETEQDD